MKYFKSQHELIRAWHSQSHTSGRTAAHIFFEGDTIYSYGRHFPIATIEPGGRIILTLRSYSPTTARHIRNVYNSLTTSEYVNAVRMYLGATESENKFQFLHKITELRKLRDKSRTRRADYDTQIATYKGYFERYLLYVGHNIQEPENIFTQDF